MVINDYFKKTILNEVNSGVSLVKLTQVTLFLVMPAREYCIGVYY